MTSSARVIHLDAGAGRSSAVSPSLDVAYNSHAIARLLAATSPSATPARMPLPQEVMV